MATAKKTPIAYAVNPLSIALDAPITSLTDLGYQQGKTEDASDNQAKYAISSIDGFPEKIDDDSKAKLYKGYMMRYNDKHAPVTYGIVDGNYLLLDSLDKDMQDKVKEKVVIQRPNWCLFWSVPWEFRCFRNKCSKWPWSWPIFPAMKPRNSVKP